MLGELRLPRSRPRHLQLPHRHSRRRQGETSAFFTFSCFYECFSPIVSHISPKLSLNRSSIGSDQNSAAWTGRTALWKALLLQNARCELCVSYEVGHARHWDNNDGRNYVLDWKHGEAGKVRVTSGYGSLGLTVRVIAN